MINIMCAFLHAIDIVILSGGVSNLPQQQYHSIWCHKNVTKPVEQVYEQVICA